ncbi:hypothetical protein A3H87_01815 [Candidatus Curtissbacteria bacterium RIFCSPLOWO2_02_FULL_42_37]|uniref:Uncharacterized protein n=2 Tax=Candidatus Curtissiibacteriota TaxID=1752717 RepID=A0A1F5H836_9BACT|nr:MAG: hypothetical protein A2693_03180 [Candidatus Curtissbacteria bacterium RIFCSPHIGHO2_01_FULL_40_12]OGD92329.1 MAG: hypothetical protein A3C33_01400 [Candidatus Curtissbacteria bacterium RIFCSPHIGHO2_02_FULL_42_58]OGD96996.1 MAG: hypothetical protein A3E71_01485 [Candidatus Curtissbacteria bacterium RIFCSPHIGHO2_12_FULL_42_33]OGE00205.1 MAG: hypothetical protein A3B54_02480 [Candidatus Curtissbacteria bacterium RIFCSPLOWO2_01_FULL_42_50]OGE09995.1 MAG: hypothetical protein A3H87_01815 [Ca
METLKGINLFSIIASVAILIVALSFAYYLVIFLPSKEKTMQEQASKELQLKQAEQQKKDKEAQVYKDCDDEAAEGARELLKSKIEIAQNSGTAIPSTWKEASEKGLHLKDDYNSYYENCLRRNGIKY